MLHRVLDSLDRSEYLSVLNSWLPSGPRNAIYSVLPSSALLHVEEPVSVFPGGMLPFDRSLKMGMILLLPFILTYFLTSIKSRIRSHHEDVIKQPPIIPYCIPFLGNTLSLLWDPHNFFHWITKKYGYSTPVRVRLGPFKMYLVTGADHFTAVLKAPSKCMSTNPGFLLALENVMGVPPDTMPHIAADDSGINASPLPGSKVKPEHRLSYLEVKAAHKHLSGSSLVQMTDRFLTILRRRVHDGEIGYEWVDLPDLYSFLQHEIFYAATEAMCGSYLLSRNPTFVEDFWEFDRSVPLLVKGLPRCFAPRPHKVRDRLLEAIKQWHELANKNSDFTATGAHDPEWDPYFGSKLVKARQEYRNGMWFMNAEASAAEDLGLIFASSTNAIPAIWWFFLEVYRDPSLLSRVRREIEDSQSQSSDIGQGEFDIKKLCSQPLLQSVYAETLRLRIAITMTRTPEREDFHLGGWTLPKGIAIVLSSRIAAMNPYLWNAGSSKHPHPLDEFWAERFLTYPDDPTSGPLRKEKLAGDDEPCESADGNSQTGPKFSMEGVEGGWTPYGGGQRMCPGRHFAKQEIICTFATLFTLYDIELLTPKDYAPKADMKFFGLGGLPPVGKAPFRIKRRYL